MHIYFDPGYCLSTQTFDTFRKAGDVAGDLERHPVPGVVLRSPDRATRDDLLLAHDEEYVDAVITGEPADLAGSNTVGWDPHLFDATTWSTGGVITATLDAFRSGSISGSLSSGLHHARADRGNGYRTFNGLAIAATRARLAGAARVLILDLDAHCGGGTASIIAGQEGIEQVDVSVNGFDRYFPTVNAKQAMASADDYLEVVRGELDDIMNPSGVSVMIYNAGMDPHENAGGPVGITRAMLEERERMVFEWASRHGIPTAFVLAGGYRLGRDSMDEVVALHRLTIETAARVAV
jgi:acetoin utilization deacetylase AcuC-like enzyme